MWPARLQWRKVSGQCSTVRVSMAMTFARKSSGAIRSASYLGAALRRALELTQARQTIVPRRMSPITLLFAFAG